MCGVLETGMPENKQRIAQLYFLYVDIGLLFGYLFNRLYVPNEGAGTERPRGHRFLRLVAFLFLPCHASLRLGGGRRERDGAAFRVLAPGCYRLLFRALLTSFRAVWRSLRRVYANGTAFPGSTLRRRGAEPFTGRKQVAVPLSSPPLTLLQ